MISYYNITSYFASISLTNSQVKQLIENIFSER